MNYRTEEIITNVGFVGSIAISLAACVWFCTSQNKLVKNTKRIANALEVKESENDMK